MDSDKLIIKCLTALGGLYFVLLFAFQSQGAYENLIMKGGIIAVVIGVIAGIFRERTEKKNDNHPEVFWHEDNRKERDS